jgi:hypothetical protein
MRVAEKLDWKGLRIFAIPGLVISQSTTNVHEKI